MNKIKAYHPALMKSNYACFGFQNTFIRWIIIFTMLLSIPEMSWGQQQQEKIDSLKTLLEKTNIDTKKIPLFLQLASCYDTLEQNIAFSYADSAFNCAESSNDNILITNTSNEAGIIFLQSGEFAEALKYFFISLEYSNKTDDPKTNASILSNIANVYLNLGQAPEAIQYWEQSLLVNEQNIITDSIPNCIIKLSDCYQKMGQETKSIEY
ncbi:MAG: tetratricopeptide repeat protein, partial [Bacteroidales bacterium]|nr:tetratricopeptide repeat protein [Bacteroidales bacterium]